MFTLFVLDEPEEVVPQVPHRHAVDRVGGTRRNRTMRAQAEYARRLRGQVIAEEDEGLLYIDQL